MAVELVMVTLQEHLEMQHPVQMDLVAAEDPLEEIMFLVKVELVEKELLF